VKTRSSYRASPELKKDAKLPATAVRTKSAQHSRPTSTILPPVVSGFFMEDDTVRSSL
jgi:hypothetical protein